jgi:hypothetical protein
MFISVLAVCSYSQVVSNSKPKTAPAWQSIDQLCGQLELSAPLEKHLVVNGKPEKRLYANYVERAKVGLHPATNDDSKCCGNVPIAQTESGRFGAFALEGIKKGKYWLRVQKDSLVYLVPLSITNDFKAQACHDSSVGRSVVLDSNPPSVETRIR